MIGSGSPGSGGAGAGIAALLCGAALLPAPAATVAALAAVIVLGIPHGALDGEVARTALRPRLGRAWFPVFALPYLSLVALALVGWRVAPMPALATFLAASVWHFGSEDAPSSGLLGRLVAGGLPIAVPTLVHPAATARVFATVAGVPFAGPPAWLVAGALAWVVLALASLAGTPPGERRALLRPLLLVAAFVALPPLVAFALYFVGVHAPAHTAALIADPRRAERVRDAASARLRSLPLTALTIAIGAALWPLYGGALPEHLLALTIQGLAALTLPHMLLDLWLTHRERSAAKSAAPAPVVPRRGLVAART